MLPGLSHTHERHSSMQSFNVKWVAGLHGYLDRKLGVCPRQHLAHSTWGSGQWSAELCVRCDSQNAGA